MAIAGPSTRHLAALCELASAASVDSSPEALCTRALILARELLKADRVGVAWLENGVRRIFLPADQRAEESREEELSPVSIIFAASQSRLPVIVNDYQSSPSVHPTSLRLGVKAAMAVPMVVRDEVVGVLAVSSYQERQFTTEDSALLELVAAQVAPALAAWNLAEERTRQARLFATLHEMAVAIAGILDPPELALLTIAHASELLGGESAALAWFEATDGRLTVLADNDVHPDDGGVPAASPLAQAFSSGANILLEDSVAVPMLGREGSVGSLVVRRPQGKPFSEESARCLVLLAAQAAPAIEAARLTAERDSQSQLFQTLHDISVASSGVLEPETLADLLVTRTAEILGGADIGLHWWDEANHRLEQLAETVPEAAHRGLESGPDGATGRALETGMPVVLHDYPVSQGLAPAAAGATPQGSMVAVPLKVRDRVVGVFSARSTGARRFSDQQVKLLSLLAAEVAPTLEAARLHAALTDALGLAARGELQQATVSDLGRQALEGMPAERLIELATMKVRAILGTGFGAVLLLKPATANFTFAATDGWPEGLATPELDTSPRRGPGFVLAAAEPVFSADLVEERRFEAPLMLAAGVRSMFGTALPGPEGPIGILIGGSVHPRQFTAEDAHFIQSVANIVGPAVHRDRVVGELEETKAKLEAIVDNVPLVLFALEPDGTVSYSGGRGREAIGNLPWAASLLSAYAGEPAVLDAIRRSLAGEPVRGQLHSKRLGGDFEFNLRPLLDGDGRVVRVIGVAMDISQRLRGELAAEENAAKSRFLANMSHELRTPLNSILGFTQLLQAPGFEPLSERQSRYVGHIKSSGRHLLELINDVLDLSKVAAGQMPVHPAQLDAGGALEEVRLRMQPLAAAKGLALSADIDAGLLLWADPLRFSQILYNLLSNAIKFTETGSIRLIASSSDGMTSISVSDTGVGISDSELDGVFREFVQVDSAFTRQKEGTGLGLSLTKRLVELMGGRIAVVSQPGRGSTFTVTLPARQPEAA